MIFGSHKPRFSNVLAVLAALVLIAGCEAGMTPQARELLNEANSALSRNDRHRTISLTTRFLAENPKSLGRDQAFYLRGMAKYRLRNYDAAAVDFQQAVAEANTDRVKAYAQTQLAEIAYREGSLQASGRYARQALELVDPNSPPADQLYYRLGCVLQRQGRWRDADAQFGHVNFYFKGSELAKRSLDRMSAEAWTIRAGLYQNRRYALSAAGELKDKGFAAEVLVEVRQSRLWYLVQVGRYETMEAAMARLDDVKAIRSDAYVDVTR